MIDLSQNQITAANPCLKSICLHLLDLENGRSDRTVNVLLEHSQEDGWCELAFNAMDFSGTEKELLATENLATGIYRISINLADTDLESPYPYLPVVFQVSDTQNDYKISIMISAHGYTVSIDC